MRASIKWLQDYVEIKETPEKLADMLTMAGIPVEAVERLGQNISGVVTGKVLEMLPILMPINYRYAKSTLVLKWLPS